MRFRFQNRADAGQQLAAGLLEKEKGTNPVVLALPRGGVPVAWKVAEAFQAPLDICLVRKIGAPGHAELALGAIASGGTRVLNDSIVEALGVSAQVIEAATRREQQELERRERVYRGDRSPLGLRKRRVFLIDDGLATGATMKAAVAAVQAQGPQGIVVGVPVGSREACADLRSEVDDLLCLWVPTAFHSVGLWYEDFSQTTDAEVQEILERCF